MEVVKLRLESEFLLTELEALSHFTHKVTLAFLDSVEISSKIPSQSISSKLYEDLSNALMSTFDDHVVHYPHIKVLKLTSELCFKIVNKTYLHAP